MGFFFFEVLFGSEYGLKISLFAYFSDDVAVTVAGEDFVAFEYVGVVKFFEYLYF